MKQPTQSHTCKWLSQDSNLKLKTNDLFLKIKISNELYTCYEQYYVSEEGSSFQRETSVALDFKLSFTQITYKHSYVLQLYGNLILVN